MEEEVVVVAFLGAACLLACLFLLTCHTWATHDRVGDLHHGCTSHVVVAGILSARNLDLRIADTN